MKVENNQEFSGFPSPSVRMQCLEGTFCLPPFYSSIPARVPWWCSVYKFCSTYLNNLESHHVSDEVSSFQPLRIISSVFSAVIFLKDHSQTHIYLKPLFYHLSSPVSIMTYFWFTVSQTSRQAKRAGMRKHDLKLEQEAPQEYMMVFVFFFWACRCEPLLERFSLL